MKNLHQIFAIVTFLLPISLGILHDVTNAKAFAVSTVNNEFSGLKFVYGIMFAVSAINILLKVSNKLTLVVLVIYLISHYEKSSSASTFINNIEGYFI
jgi:hypothetical protein